MQSPNSVTQHFAVPSAPPVYIKRFATTKARIGDSWPSMVCKTELSKTYSLNGVATTLGCPEIVSLVLRLRLFFFVVVVFFGPESIFRPDLDV